MENGHITGSFDIFECVIDGVGLQFEGGKKWTMPIHNWRLAMNWFMIQFDDRLKDHL